MPRFGSLAPGMDPEDDTIGQFAYGPLRQLEENPPVLSMGPDVGLDPSVIPLGIGGGAVAGGPSRIGRAARAAPTQPAPGTPPAPPPISAIPPSDPALLARARFGMPAILGRRMPTPEDIASIRASAAQFGHAPWPTAEREIFSTTPEAYGETTLLVPQVSIKGQLPGPLPGESLPNKGRASPIIAQTPELGANIASDLYPLVRDQSPLLKFYHTGPVIRGIENYGEMSTPEAAGFLRNWAGQGAATSPRTSTPPNLRNSSWLLYNRLAGTPYTPERFEQEGNVPGYGMMGMHYNLANQFATGTENLWTNPKPGTFRENWSGNLRDVTGDTHNIRATLYKFDQAYPGQIPRDWFTSDDAYNSYRLHGFGTVPPGHLKDTLGDVTVNKIRRQSEYLPMTEPWYLAAQHLGIAPAEAQSGGWFHYGGTTGLASPPKTITNLLNDQIEATAKAINVPPERVVNWWSRGLIPLTSIAGMAAGVGSMLPHPSQARSFGSLAPPSRDDYDELLRQARPVPPVIPGTGGYPAPPIGAVGIRG